MKLKFTLLYIVACVALNAMAQKKQLLVLHTNDTHSCIKPLNANLADTAIADRGGYVRRISLIKEERRQHPDLLLFDSGDFSQGSPFYSLFKGDVEVGLMNQMHYDAATIGNHEFDFGLDNMARIFKMAKFPIVCSNYDFTGTPLASVVKPWTVLKRDGMKIGVFGICPELDGLVTAANYKGVTYQDPIAKGNEVAKYLKEKEKCDLVICLSHLGWDIDGVDDIEFIQGTRNIDLVLGAHTHTYFSQLEYVKNLDGKLIPDDQNGKNAIWVGKIAVNMKEKNYSK